jgi:hypothetical protein
MLTRLLQTHQPRLNNVSHGRFSFSHAAVRISRVIVMKSAQDSKSHRWAAREAEGECVTAAHRNRFSKSARNLVFWT